MISKTLSPLRQKDIRTGAQQERERIVALLEEIVAEKTNAQYGANFDIKLELAQDIVFIRRITKLIKGGNE